MSTFNLKQGDRLPLVTCDLQQGVDTATPTAIDLTLASSVTFSMWDRKTKAVKVSAAACTIVTAASGSVSWAPGATDTDTPGTYDAQWRVTFSGLAMTVPDGDGYDTVIIGEKIV
jgi:hypothetical protein